jgi:hypothetical protein
MKNAILAALTLTATLALAEPANVSRTAPEVPVAAPKTEGKTEAVGKNISASQRIYLKANTPASYTRTVSAATPRISSVSRVNLRRPTSSGSIRAPLSGANTQQQAPAAGGATAQ